LRWRLARRHELEAAYQFARSGGTRVLSDTIDVADSTFAAGLRVNSIFESDQALLTYRFALSRGTRSQVGIALGVGALFFNLEIDAVAGATTGGGDTAIVPFNASERVTAPTGTLGLYGRWQLGGPWQLEVDARVLEGGAAARYYVSRRVGVELGYGMTGIKVTLDPRADGSGLSGNLKYSLGNARLGVLVVLAAAPPDPASAP
jgi:hypothetical protein